MSKTKAYNIDCMEYMSTLPDKVFDETKVSIKELQFLAMKAGLIK